MPVSIAPNKQIIFTTDADERYRRRFVFHSEDDWIMALSNGELTDAKRHSDRLTREAEIAGWCESNLAMLPETEKHRAFVEKRERRRLGQILVSMVIGRSG